ncbi:MAG: thioredoxin domain-containing protein [Candidatus Komeilibacteria bacterium]|nr:thioredoxin domain-containing protein [Candidatus Komeilibacteria bacterium]
MIIRNKTLLGALGLFVVVVGLLIAREISLNIQYRNNAQIINQSRLSEETANVPLQPILRSTDPIIGQGAKQLFFFGDFTCSACKAQWQLLRAKQQAQPKSLTIIWKDTIDLSNSESLAAAVAARCSGKDFGRAADELFKQNDQLSAARYQQIAKDLGLNQASFVDCQKNPSPTSLIQEDVQEAIALGLSQSPTVYFNNRWYVGGLTEIELSNL